MDDPGIIRNRRKIEAAVHNAQLVLAIQQEIGSFLIFMALCRPSTRHQSFSNTIRSTHPFTNF